MSKKRRKCRICKKRPIWRGGDVRNPGPVCKRCYHKRVWIERTARAPRAKPTDPGTNLLSRLSDLIDSRPWLDDDSEIFWDAEIDELPLAQEEDEMPFDWETGEFSSDADEDEIPF